MASWSPEPFQNGVVESQRDLLEADGPWVDFVMPIGRMYRLASVNIDDVLMAGRESLHAIIYHIDGMLHQFLPSRWLPITRLGQRLTEPLAARILRLHVVVPVNVGHG